MKRLALALLLAGCAGPGEIELGAGRMFRDGGFDFASASSFSDNQDSVDGSSSFSYEEKDIDSVWISYTIPLGPRRVEVIRDSSPVSFEIQHVVETPATEPPSPASEPKKEKAIRAFGVEIPVDTSPWLVLSVAVLLGAATLFGIQKGVSAYKRRRKGKIRAKG